MTADRGLGDPAAVAALARVARLPLTAERLAVVAPALAGLYADFDALDALSLGEVPPQAAFDPRWR